MNYIGQARHGVPGIPSIPAMYRWYALQPAMYSVFQEYTEGIFHIPSGIPYLSAGERPDILKDLEIYIVAC